jgi:hypothetical protein
MNKIGQIKILVFIAIALAAGVSFYFAINSTPEGGTDVPQIQDDNQVTAGLGVPNQFAVSANIDTGAAGSNVQHHPHFWVPGLDPVPGATPCVQYTPHRYPALSGGNITTVMHQGITKACTQNAPAGNDWRLNPPEVAVL